MEPFTYEVLRDTYFHICRDMATELRKICISTVIRDAQDFATAITDKDGRLVAQSIGTPGHYNSVPSAVRGMLEVFPPETLEPGDMISTGTSAGVGSAKGIFLKPGDKVEASIESIGTLVSPVVAGGQ